MFPDQLSLVLARQNVEFHPRPVMQSYAAYSPWLAEQNALHYRSDQAPEQVLFRVDPLNHQFPTLADGMLWRELLERYEIAADLGENFLLHRLSKPRVVRVAKSGTLSGGWNQWISLPEADNGLIWCRVKLSQWLGGKLASIAYKQPSVWLEVEWKDARRQTFRFIPAAGQSGFLLSPVVLTKDDFAAILNGEKTPAGSEVRAIRFGLSHEELREWLYSDAISVEFEELTFTEAHRDGQMSK